MSTYGIGEAGRWDADFRKIFTSEQRATVTDDMASYVTIGGFPATVQYQYTTPLSPRYKMTPEFIPGQSVWYHEREHHLHAKLIERIGDQHEEEFLRDLFTIRGADPNLVTQNRNLAKEQAASMLPEAFLGVWGGYQHPCPTVAISDGVSLRRFFLEMDLWEPDTAPIADHAIEWLGPAAGGNYMAGRSGNPVTMIIDHWTTGSLESALAHFQTAGTQVSAHYIVGTTGRIVRVVKDEDTAYHAGDFNVNLLAIGIEHECGPALAPTDELYAASAWLHRFLAVKHGIALEVGVTVKRHRDIIATACPGTLDVERIVNEAGGEEMTDAEFKAMYDRIIRPEIDGTVDAMKKRLAIDAHHTHTTSEPKETP